MRSAAPNDSQHILLNRALELAPTVDLGSVEAAIDTSRWTLDHSVLRLLWPLVQEMRPRHVMEFGSGLSTRVLARAATTSGGETRISSVDHDPKYGAEAAQHLARIEGADRVAFQVAPLVIKSYGGEFLPAYCIDDQKLASSDPVDLAVIDGPPEPLGGRAGTLYQIMQYSRPGALVLLDDAARPGEQAALDQWQDALGAAIEVIQPSGFPKGLAVILIHRPIAEDKLWAHRQELAIEEVVARVPPDDSLVLVDDSKWDHSQLQSHSVQAVIGEGGRRWGAPIDDRESLAWLTAVKRQGTRFIVFGWPAFWWRETYPDLWKQLQSDARCIACNQRVVIFDLQPADDEAE